MRASSERQFQHGGERLTMAEALAAIGQHKTLVLIIFFLLSAVSVALATKLVRPRYVSTASLLVQDRQYWGGTDSRQQSGGVVTTDLVAIRTQVDILRSRNLAGMVVDTLHLGDDPSFQPRPGTSAKLLALITSVFPHEQKEPAPVSAAARREGLINQLLGMMSFASDGRSYVIDISAKVTAFDPGDDEHAKVLAMALANTYAQQYLVITQDMRNASVHRVGSFFEERLATLQGRVQSAEDAVQVYRASHGLIENRGANGSGVTVAGQQLAAINNDLVAATADRVQKEASLDQFRTERSNRSPVTTVPEVVSSPLIERLRERQIQLSADEARMADRNGSAYPGLSALRSAQRDTDARINTEIGKIASSMQSAVNAARAREAALQQKLAQLQGELGKQSQSEAGLISLQHEAEAARSIYAEYLRRSAEASNIAQLQQTDAVISSTAGIPLGQTAPTAKHFAAAGVLTSLLIACVAPVVRQRMRGGFETVEQLEVGVDTEVLGMIPTVRNPNLALRFTDRGTFFAEAISSIRALLRLRMKPSAQVLLISSALPGEGKTFFSFALSRNAALAGKRVLLVDCDVRRPSIMRLAGDELGTAEAGSRQNGAETVEPVIRQDSVSSLHIVALRAGMHSPQDLFSHPKTSELIRGLRNHYDLIVLDAPPVLVVSDARVLAGLADEAMLVVNWRATPRDCVATAVNVLRSTGVRLVGSVINRVQLNRLGRTGGVYAYVNSQYAALPSPSASRK